MEIDKNQSDQSFDNLKAELDLAQKKVEEYLAGWQRAKADYLNLKKETEKRQTEFIQFANAALVAELLPIFDHYKLAIKHIPPEQKDLDWVAGFIHIKKQFVDFFSRLGIEEIKTIGEKFDPALHEAVVHEKAPGFKTDTIFAEVKSGYTLQGKVIMPAKVKVAK